MIPPPEQLLMELNRLRDTHREVAALADSDTAQWAKKLVGARKRLADETALLGEEANVFFGSGEHEMLQAEYRRRFSEMRAAAALHQAVWPAVRILTEADEYRESAESVRRAHAAFDSWARQQLNYFAKTQSL